MDFALNEEQEMLQKSARTFLSKQYSDKLFKQIALDENGCPPELWRQIVDMGWTALGIPEEYGGIGSFVDLVLVLQEMGRAGLISPFFSSTVAGASVFLEAGSPDQKNQYLPSIAEGKIIATLALSESINERTIQVKAEKNNEGYALSGRKLLVPDACSSDFMICSARIDQDVSQYGYSLFVVDNRAEGVICHKTETISGDKYAEVIFNDVRLPSSNLLGEPEKGSIFFKKAMDKIVVGQCAEMLGTMEKALELSLAYAKERMVFGHPIGAYQAVQHRCADMLIDIESTRYITYQAAWYISQGLPAAREAAIAKAWVSQACRRVMASAHQIHGAIGFTEDHILHRYTRKAWARELSFGDTNFHLGNLLEVSGQ